MIGDKYEVKKAVSFKDRLTDKIISLKEGEILTEIGAFNTETETREEAGDYNDIIHKEYGFICDAGSEFAKEALVLVQRNVPEGTKDNNLDNEDYER